MSKIRDSSEGRIKTLVGVIGEWSHHTILKEMQIKSSWKLTLRGTVLSIKEWVSLCQKVGIPPPPCAEVGSLPHHVFPLRTDGSKFVGDPMGWGVSQQSFEAAFRFAAALRGLFSEAPFVCEGIQCAKIATERFRTVDNSFSIRFEFTCSSSCYFVILLPPSRKAHIAGPPFPKNLQNPKKKRALFLEFLESRTAFVVVFDFLLRISKWVFGGGVLGWNNGQL